MPQADTFEAPQGAAFHGELTTAITEAFVGNGVLANGDAYVSADSNTAMGTVVSAADTGGIAYGGDTYNPTSSSFTHSDGPTTTTNGQDDRRVDIIYFDQSAGGYAKTEGTADPNPVPPSIPSDALLLAVVLVAHGATDLSDGDILNWRARPVSGSTTSSGRAEFGDGMHVGFDEGTVTETSSPKSFTFTAGYGHDVSDQVDVTISNSSGASATEDITVELYDGVDTTGTLVNSETQSVSVGDGNSKTVTFLTGDNTLDDGDYHINISQSGTDLSIDQTDAVAPGLLWSFTETASGTLQLTNQYDGTVALEYDPLTNELGLLSGAIDTAEIAATAVTTAKVAAGAITSTEIDSSAVTTAKIASGAVTSTEISDGTIADADVDSSTTIARGKLDDERITTGAVTSNTTTSGEEVILVDTSGGAVTITLASADVSQGNFVTVIDVGGAASTNAITIDTESSEGIDGGSSTTIEDDYGASVVASDGSNWFTAGGGTGGGVILEDDQSVAVDPAEAISAGAGLSATADGDGTGTVDVEHTEVCEGRESGSVSAGNQGVVLVDSLSPDETAEIYKGVLVNADGTAAASGVDLVIATLDNSGGYTAQTTLISGDGSTVFDDETGSPLGSYTNTGTSTQTIAVLVDNGTTNAVSIAAVAEGVTGV